MGAVKRQQATAGVLPFHCGIACCIRNTDAISLPIIGDGGAFQLLTSWALRPLVCTLEPHNEICTLGDGVGEIQHWAIQAFF